MARLTPPHTPASFPQAQCAACHLAKETDKSPPIGPQLLGVVGRKAGSWDHFAYTPAMKKAARQPCSAATKPPTEAAISDPMGTAM